MDRRGDSSCVLVTFWLQQLMAEKRLALENVLLKVPFQPKACVPFIFMHSLGKAHIIPPSDLKSLFCLVLVCVCKTCSRVVDEGHAYVICMRSISALFTWGNFTARKGGSDYIAVVYLPHRNTQNLGSSLGLSYSTEQTHLYS